MTWNVGSELLQNACNYLPADTVSIKNLQTTLLQSPKPHATALVPSWDMNPCGCAQQTWTNLQIPTNTLSYPVHKGKILALADIFISVTRLHSVHWFDKVRDFQRDCFWKLDATWQSRGNLHSLASWFFLLLWNTGHLFMRLLGASDQIFTTVKTPMLTIRMDSNLPPLMTRQNISFYSSLTPLRFKNLYLFLP